MDINTIVLVLTLLSGVALFLYGMSVMGDGLKQMAGNKLELILYKLTNTPLKGLLLGAAVTAVIQSSSATTVMVVGFVNSGMMKVAQAIGIIMGANIGTSITGWILCLSYIDGQQGIAQLLSTATISAIVAILGIIFRTFLKKDVYRQLGNIMLGFAILMIGMQTMSGAVAPLKDSPAFVSMLTSFTNPVLGIVFGIALTAVLQSASAAVGVLQALSVTGAIVFQSAYPMIMGIGIGAACPVLLSAMGTNKYGKRTALVYLINDVFAMILGTTLFYSVNAFVHFDFYSMTMSPFSVALLNTVYRAAAMIILLPFVKGIEKIVMLLVPGKDEDDDEDDDFELLEERFLSYPAIAINQCHRSIVMMAKSCLKNLSRAFTLYGDFSDKLYKKVQNREKKVDKYEDKIGAYLIQLTGKEMTEIQSKEVSEYLHCIGDFERTGDHAYHIAHIGKDMSEKGIRFSSVAEHELSILESATKDIMDLTIDAFENQDMDTAKHVEPLKDLISILCDELKMRHVQRLRDGICSLDQGIYYSELLNNLERIADHCSNVAVCLLEMATSDYDSHAYLSQYRREKTGEYATYFKEYDEKYGI
ncbi:Na/Pi cotransporter family protein [uncultured Dubosiella sp.]|uniref:Na/Pi cotransporter family protein n=1 Tax=uncultured Dubosiella sp. TaxID=1937011 RepID=UPI002731AE20|nr:Na/Pi cotransporter family protein [uncultured Dubosiella sp.]